MADTPSQSGQAHLVLVYDRMLWVLRTPDGTVALPSGPVGHGYDKTAQKNWVVNMVCDIVPEYRLVSPDTVGVVSRVLRGERHYLHYVVLHDDTPEDALAADDLPIDLGGHWIRADHLMQSPLPEIEKMLVRQMRGDRRISWPGLRV